MTLSIFLHATNCLLKKIANFATFAKKVGEIGKEFNEKFVESKIGAFQQCDGDRQRPNHLIFTTISRICKQILLLCQKK